MVKKWQVVKNDEINSLQQIAPYIGRISTDTAKTLIKKYTKTNATIFEPFSGSGVIALEAQIAGRKITACDINPYAYTITSGKLNAPKKLSYALKSLKQYEKIAIKQFNKISLKTIPKWVKSFFHPDTLKEITTYINIFKTRHEYFFLSCLLGILHHQRPGFLSYPSSNFVPYLRVKKFPIKKYPEMYEYRDVMSRLIKKVNRTYRHFPLYESRKKFICKLTDSLKINLKPNSIDAIITSPPYMNTLTYGRDNRLRLWFLVGDKYKIYDKLMPQNIDAFRKFIKKSLIKFSKILKLNGLCILVIGDLNRKKQKINSMQIVLDESTKLDIFKTVNVFEDKIPLKRRARRNLQCTKKEWIIILKKRGKNVK